MGIKEILSDIRPDKDFYNSERYIDDGLLDSLDLMQLVERIEDMYEIEIDVLEISMDDFQNEDSIKNLITRMGGTIDRS